jgi:predicted transcriptional regulator of viral defense system
MKRTKLPEVAAIAADQWGLVSTAQALDVGVKAQTLARLAGRGVLERLTHGIYRLSGSPVGQHDNLRAAWIALDPRRTAAERIADGPTEVVSHRSAAAVHEIGDLVPDRLEFTAPVRRQIRRSDVHVYRGRIGADDWTLVDGLPVTTALRTISDLAAGPIDQGHLAGLVRDALVRQLTTPAQVMAVLATHAQKYDVTAGDGGELLNALLDEAGVPQSTLEMAARTQPRDPPEHGRVPR